MGSRAPLIALAVLASTGFAAAAPAGAARQSSGAPATPKPYLDVRDGQPRAAAPSVATRRARSRLRAGGAVIDVDARTGTPRLLAGTVAPLSARAAGPAVDVADAFVSRHLPALGLDRGDLGSLRLSGRKGIPGGATQVTYRQYADGIPALDSGLEVTLDEAGRAIAVTGAPQPGLALATTTPALSATRAMRALMDDVGAHHALAVASGPSGPTRATTFDSGEAAALVAFGEGTGARLAWQLDLRAGPGEHYTAVVDAAGGKVLQRANRVKFAGNDASVFEQYPGAANGGTTHTVDLTPYLNPGATDLSGPYAHAWSDTNDNDFAHFTTSGHIVSLDAPDANEAVPRTGGGDFVYAFSPFSQAAGACDNGHVCSWDFGDRPSWTGNRAQNAVQAFYYVNRYRDHLAAPPISFSSADGDFRGADRVLVNADDGAATDTSGPGSGGPDANHLDNAYMDTPPDGTSPTMAMFLFYAGSSSPFRDVNGGDDAAIVYHEFTHGLSNRLITNASGEGALNGVQPGALGEAWSDWYAKDFLVDQFPADDTTAPGEVDIGEYVDSVPHSIRTQALDCPVGAASTACPGGFASGSGGFTYGDLGRICICGLEVHADGEIWGETLWDLRSLVGSGVAEAVITQGMRLTPAQPTFLQARDAILAADLQLYPDGDHSGQLWQAFGRRGMGWNATSPSASTAVEGFKTPPAATLTAAPSPAVTGRPATLDASGSTDADGSVTTYDFDLDGDGTNEITGTTVARQSFTYATAGVVHPRVTVHDDEGRIDTAAIALAVVAPPAAAASPAPTGSPTRPAGRGPRVSITRTGTKARARFTVTCDAACTGTASITIPAKAAKRLGLGRKRTVARATFSLAAGTHALSVRISGTVRKAMQRKHVKRVATRVTVRVKDVFGRTAKPSRAVTLRG
jgi:extracellular elastinolytic metalloproteinase